MDIHIASITIELSSYHVHNVLILSNAPLTLIIPLHGLSTSLVQRLRSLGVCSISPVDPQYPQRLDQTTNSTMQLSSSSTWVLKVILKLTNRLVDEIAMEETY